MDSTEAIVIRSVDFSETSLILTLYSRDFGKMRVIAKGGRRIKGPFESALDLLARIRLTVIRKKSESLDILTESKLIDRFRPTASNLAGLYAGYAAVELINELTEEGDANANLYDILRFSLVDFALGTYVMRSLIRFEWTLLDLSGLKPSLEFCVECGQEINDFSTGRITFAHLDGGVLCPDCRPGHQQLASVRVETIRTLCRLIDRKTALSDEYDKRSWTQFPIDRSILGEMRGLTNHYLIHLLGKKPKLLDSLTQIAQFDNEPPVLAEDGMSGSMQPFIDR